MSMLPCLQLGLIFQRYGLAYLPFSCFFLGPKEKKGEKIVVADRMEALNEVYKEDPPVESQGSESTALLSKLFGEKSGCSPILLQ